MYEQNTLCVFVQRNSHYADFIKDLGFLQNAFFIVIDIFYFGIFMTFNFVLIRNDKIDDCSYLFFTMTGISNKSYGMQHNLNKQGEKLASHDIRSKIRSLVNVRASSSAARKGKGMRRGKI